MKKEVEPDYKHAWRLFSSILLLPITLLLVLFKRKKPGELFAPVTELWKYFWEARVTAILIVANIVVYVFLMFYLGGMTGAQQDAFAEKYLMDGPANLLSLNLFPFFANWFVHLSFSHLLGNMVALLILGRVVEKNFGPGKFLMIYVGSGIASGLVDDLVHLSNTGYYANGASGAIAGLASAAMLVEPFYIVYLFIIPIPVFLFGWMQVYTDVTDVLNPSDNGIANFAHLGGFFAITILVLFMRKEDKSKMFRGLVINIVTLAVLGLAWYASKT
jgi:membrane associated rhomboid family serine protease